MPPGEIKMLPYHVSVRFCHTLEEQFAKHELRSSTQRVFMTAINWVTLFKEIIAVYCENYTKSISTP
jgi:hypothetical protein